MKTIKHFENPTDTNFLIRKLSECPQKKSDNGNGYYIVSDTWGTCFFRIAQNKDRIEIRVFNRSSKKISYTKIPLSRLENCYHIYLNTKKGACIQLPKGSAIIGCHEPILDNTNSDYFNYSFLIYSPTDEEIEIVEIENPIVLFEKETYSFQFDIDKFSKEGYVKYIDFTEDGYPV